MRDTLAGAHTGLWEVRWIVSGCITGEPENRKAGGAAMRKARVEGVTSEIEILYGLSGTPGAAGTNW